MVYAQSALPKSLENPKSAILIFPLCFNIFASLKSLCMILALTRSLNAWNTYNRYSTPSSSVSNFFALMY